MSEKHELTICSVSYYSQELLELNWKITSSLNDRTSSYQWIIVDNTPEKEIGKPRIQDENCLILEGTQLDLSLPKKVRGSYHHAAALNKTLAHIKTRFVLFLDPDFYTIAQKNWIETIIQYMLNNNLSFFGVPWHPKYTNKYRYFPCVHCLFIDLKKVPIQTLDFTPDINLVKEKLEKQKNITQTKQIDEKNIASIDLKEESITLFKLGKIYYQKLKTKLKRKIRNFDKFKQKMSVERRKLLVNSSQDTGYKIFQQYGQKYKVNYEVAVPVYKLKSDLLVPEYFTYWQNIALEKFLPETLCYLPKQANSYSEIGFKELGYPDLYALGWEEFLWQGKPFGFHLRLQQQESVDIQQQTRSLAEVLEICLAKANETF